MSKIYLTGGGGFVGTNIQEQIKADFKCYKRGQGIDIIEEIKEFKPDYIIHAGAEIYDEEEMIWSNVNLTHTLLKHTIDLPYKAFIYIGTSSEYGLRNGPMKEDDLIRPSTLYGATKASATLLCQAYARQYKRNIMIARPFSLYGKHEPEHRFIPTAINCLKTGAILPVAPGSHDFLYIDDFIHGIKLMMKEPQVGEIYNFCTGRQFSNMDVVLELVRISGKYLETKSVGKMRSFDTDYWLGDNTKARIDLGWFPNVTLQEGLARLI